MNRSQLPRRVHRAFQCLPTTINVLRNRLCAHVFILLSHALVVALSARQWQSFHRRLSSLARNVAKNAASSFWVPDSHQETFRFIRYTSLNPRGGTRRSMVKPIARKASVAQSLVSDAMPNVHLPHKQQPVSRGNIQCRSFLYPCIGCTSPRCFLPASWGIRATHARFTL